MQARRTSAEIANLLKSSGLRPTRQRMALAKLLFQNGDRHVTAEMLHDEAEAARVKVSMATVYNALHQFVGARLLKEIVVDPNRSYFDTNLSDHYHFYHERSGRVEDIPPALMGTLKLPSPTNNAPILAVDVIVRVDS